MNNKIPTIIELPKLEQEKFDALIKKYRDKYIRPSSEIVDLVLSEDKEFLELIKSKQMSLYILKLREKVWQEYLNDEIDFNAVLMKDLHKLLDTPKEILEILLSDSKIIDKKGEELVSTIKEVCGEYAGRVFPYIYRLSLSNTQSRRSRAGKTFEVIIYKVYEILGYDYDSQS